MGRPLGKLMCVRLRVCASTLLHMCVCVYAPALTSLLSSLQPPHSDSPVTEGLTTSHALPPQQLPCSSSPCFIYNSHSPSPPHLYFIIHLSVHYLSVSFHPPSFFPFFFVFISRPLIGVWVFPVFRHALCAHCAVCLCLYGNPEWTRVPQRSARR